MKEKLEVLYVNVEDVEGDTHKTHMKLKDKEKLCVEAQVKLDKSPAKVVTTQEETTSLEIKLDKLLESRVDFVVVGYNSKDELKFINDGITDLRDQIVITTIKVKDLKVDKIEAKNDLWRGAERLMVAKDNFNILEEVVAKQKVQYEMASQQLRAIESWIYLIQNQLQRMEKGWVAPYILSPLCTILSLLKTYTTI